MTTRVTVLPQHRSWALSTLVKIFPTFEHAWITVGSTIYHPNYVKCDIEQHRYVLVHEIEHVRQYNRYSVPLFLFLYWLIPLPFGFAFFRWKFEREAFLQELLAKYQDAFVDGDIICTHANYWETQIEVRVDSLQQFYLYPWPRSLMLRWLRKAFNRGTAAIHNNLASVSSPTSTPLDLQKAPSGVRDYVN